jgi:hypothetical protein
VNRHFCNARAKSIQVLSRERGRRSLFCAAYSGISLPHPRSGVLSGATLVETNRMKIPT